MSRMDLERIDLKHEAVGIYAVWLREFKRFYRDRPRLLSSIARPLMWLLIMGVGIGSSMRFSGMDVEYLPFLTPGIIGMSVLFTSLFSGVSVIWDREFGFLKEILVAPISRVSIVVGKALGGATSSVFQSIIISAIAMLLGVSLGVSAVALTICAVVLISVGFVALGISIASMMDSMEGFNMIMNFIVMPMFMLSGALFPINSLPESVAWIPYANPMTYGVELLRYTMIGSSSIPLTLSLGVVVLFSTSTSIVASMIFGKRK
jgi:ABC-2 type transport system permease protein